MAKKTSSDDLDLRQSLVDACLWMNASGINQGTSGNVSVRSGEMMLITPSGVPYDEMRPQDIAAMPLEGEYGSFEGALKPSSEWRFHLDIMKARPNVGAIVHTHSTYATVISCTRRAIPAVHYMIAASGGSSVRCADYATFGTKELSENALMALEDRSCCILANHGAIATGTNLAKAKWLASELETLAKQYYMTLTIGGAVILDEAEITKNVGLFSGYGPRATAEPAKAAMPTNKATTSTNKATTPTNKAAAAKPKAKRAAKKAAAA